MSDTKITRDEWLAEFERLTATDNMDGWLTTNEIADLTGWGLFKIRTYLRELDRRGLLAVSRKQIEKLGGGNYTSACYRIVRANHEEAERTE